ncbi:MAG: hypothetical protein FJX65_03485 [Alphaproteobacteria bacterium]|nr:hypothetical protein [Alphaproteobacteria bacterium]
MLANPDLVGCYSDLGPRGAVRAIVAASESRYTITHPRTRDAKPNPLAPASAKDLDTVKRGLQALGVVADPAQGLMHDDGFDVEVVVIFAEPAVHPWRTGFGQTRYAISTRDETYLVYRVPCPR